MLIGDVWTKTHKVLTQWDIPGDAAERENWEFRWPVWWTGAIPVYRGGGSNLKPHAAKVSEFK